MEEVKTQPVVINENELMVMSEFIKNLDVTFEIVSPIKDIDFVVSKPDVSQIAVFEHKIVTKEEEQITFSFDLPIAKSEPAVVDENKILFELSNETKDIKVKEPVQVVTMTELNENGIIKYSLEEYMELEDELLNSKPLAVVEEPIAEEMNITVKKVEQESGFIPTFKEVSPMEMSIDDATKLRADERRRKLKEFNYKFHNNPSKVDEYEKEPAYKRSGVDLSSTPNTSQNSRMSLGTDSNDDIQLRSNNSYLHDNVD